MEKQSLDEILTEVLIIKDLYICGRLNQEICSTVTTISANSSSGVGTIKSSKNWKKYKQLSKTYRDDSISEFLMRKDRLTEGYYELGPVSVEVIFDTTYDDFDTELFNDMMEDYYGGPDTVAFANSYTKYAEEFNAILSEYFI